MRRTLPFVFLSLTACGGGGDAPAADAGGGPGGAGGFRFPVTFVLAGEGEIEERVTVVGDVETARRAVLAFERAGRVAEMLAAEGARVEAGALLARLDDAVLQAELRAAQASAAADRVDADFAAQELQRALGLGDALAQSERDRWRSETAAREARAARSAAEVGRLEALLAQGELRAPFTGTVVARRATLGSHAAPGAAILELVDLDALEARLELPVEAAALLHEGEAVRIEGGAVVLDLRLDAILPSADPGTRTFRAIARFAGAAAPGLRPGAFVRASLVLRRGAGVLVPHDALLFGPQGEAIVVAEGGADGAPPVARFVPVRVLARGGAAAAVASIEPGGLQSGARVVVTGVDNVFPGAPLLLQEHAAPAAQ